MKYTIEYSESYILRRLGTGIANFSQKYVDEPKSRAIIEKQSEL